MAVGVVPIAVSIGVLLSTSELTTVQAVASGPMILAGASQLAALELLRAGAAPQLVVMSALMLNTRILMYGAALAPWFGRERLGTRMLLAIPIIDQLYFLCVPRFVEGDLDRRGRIAFYTGAAIWLYGTWWATQLLAYALGPCLLGVSSRLTIVAPLALAGLLAKAVADRAALAAAACAALVAVLAAPCPFEGALVIGAVSGALLGSGISSRLHEETTR